MGHLLPTDGLRWIQEAQRALLSLDGPGASSHPIPSKARRHLLQKTWIERTFEPLRRLLGTDHVYYVAPELQPSQPPMQPLPSGLQLGRSEGDCSEGSLVVCSPSGGEAFARDIAGQLAGYEGGFMQLRDPYATYLHAAARQYGVSALHDGFLYDPYDESGLRRASVIHQEIYRPLGIERQMALSVPLPRGEAMLLFGYRREDMPAFGGPEHSALKLLLPAFEAGLHFRQRLGAVSQRWTALVDALPCALAVFGTAGNELHRNRALRRLLAAEPDAEVLLQAVRAFALETIPILTSRSRQADLPLPYAGEQRGVLLSGGNYWLRGSFDASSLGVPALLVSVEHALALPSAVLLQKRFGLTPREVEVAKLLVQGYTDKEVAEKLFVSPHTARRHSESILKKMGLSSRAGVAHACLQAGWRG